MREIPDTTPSPAWQDALTGHELHQLAAALSSRTIASRRATVSVLARRMTAEGIEPAAVTKPALQAYLVAEIERRRHSGATTVYASLNAFFDWWSEEYGAPSPMTGIPRPKGQSAPVTVLSGDQIKAIMKATAGKDWEAVRNRAIVLLMLETGIRHHRAVRNAAGRACHNRRAARALQ